MSAATESVEQKKLTSAVTVTTNPQLQITTGIQLMTSDGPGIAIPTAPGGGNPTTATLTMGQWIMDPTHEYVLMLTSQGLVLYQVIGNGDPTTGRFQGSIKWGPEGGDNSFVFCAQSDGNAVVYDNQFPTQWNPQWAANKGGSNAQYLFVNENGSFAVVQYSPTFTSD